MELTQYESAAEFLKRARASLEEREAANNLIIGIAARAAEQPGVYKHGIYIAAVDEDGEVVAAALRTPPHRVVVYNKREDDLAPLRLILDDLIAFAQAQPPDSPAAQLSGVNAHSATALAFAQLWAERTGRGFKPGMSLRIYELREVNPPQTPPGHMRPASEEEFDLLAEWVYSFNVDCHLPEINREEARELAARLLANGNIFFWEVDGRPVSMAARGRTSSHGITVNMVYTPLELRGRGFASACVAALSQQLLDNGWQFCTLYTDLSNPTSNDIYQRIGYRPVCDSMEYVFDSP